MSNRKRICVITAQVEESTQNRFMQGFLKQAYDMNYDVCIFSMFLKYQDSADREVGDSNIYNLINFNLFDAVVLCQDTIQTPGVVEKLEKRLQSEFANGVVVVVDKENNIFPTVMMDRGSRTQEYIFPGRTQRAHTLQAATRRLHRQHEGAQPAGYGRHDILWNILVRQRRLHGGRACEG